MVKQYKKKPVIIEALQFINHNHKEIEDFCGNKARVAICDTAWQVGKGIPHDWIEIETLEGTMRADEGDFIIKGVNGEFYPCKPDIFEKTYSNVETSYKDRLWLEYAELTEKAIKLSDFIESDKIETLSVEKLNLLSLQLQAMDHYRTILLMRMSLEGIDVSEFAYSDNKIPRKIFIEK